MTEERRLTLKIRRFSSTSMLLYIFTSLQQYMGPRESISLPFQCPYIHSFEMIFPRTFGCSQSTGTVLLALDFLPDNPVEIVLISASMFSLFLHFRFHFRSLDPAPLLTLSVNMLIFLCFLPRRNNGPVLPPFIFSLTKNRPSLRFSTLRAFGPHFRF